MQSKWKQKLNLWKIMFSQQRNVITFFTVLVIFYLLNATMAVYPRISYTDNLFELVALYTQGFCQTVGTLGFILNIIVSILTGFLLTLLIFRAVTTESGIDKKLSLFGYLSLFFGFFVSGCPTCGLGLLAVLGLGASVVALPFGGKEISIISIVILTLVINAISNKILFCKVSEVKKFKI